MNEKYLLEVNHLNKRIQNADGSFALKDIDFKVEPGYIVGLIGCNGAGKTTLLNTIMGLYSVEPGAVKINGHDRITDMRAAKQEIAFVNDICLLPVELSAKSWGKLFGPMYHGFDLQRFKKLCDRFQIPWRKPVFMLSKGTIIKAQLAFCLSYSASLYIFDEPSAGLDPVFRSELLEIFFEIVSDGTKSIVLSTQLTDELDRVADYILCLDQGHQLFYTQKDILMEKYLLIKGSESQINYYRDYIVGRRKSETYSEALIRNEVTEFPVSVTKDRPTIEDLMYLFKKGEK